MHRMLPTIPAGLLGFVLLMLLVLQLSIPAQALPQQPTSLIHSAKKILVLYTYGEALPGYRKANAAFWPVITGGGVSTDDIFSEYLDLQRNQGVEYRQRLADLLRYKYAMREIGLIVTVHTEALNFLLNEGKGLFPDVPVFSYLIVRPELIEAKNTGRRILQRAQSLDVGGTLDVALEMFPETRKVVFVSGTADGDRRLEHEARRIFEPWLKKLEFQYTSDRSIEEILQLVASLPPGSIVIYNNVFSDKTGRTFTPLEVGKRVAKAANAPVFCLWDTLMGSGPIGGSLLSFEAEGAYAAKVALEILDGKILLTKPVTTLPASKTFMFDWRQLRRWGVNESILPKGSIVLNRESSFWDFKYYIIGILAVGVLQWLLIAGLLAQRRRRAKADEALKERLRFERLLSDLSAKFLNIAPHEIDREIEGALKGIVDFFHVSHSVLTRGFPEEHRAVFTHAAHADDVPPTPLGANLYAFVPWTFNRMAQGEALRFTTVDGLPPDAAADKDFYRNLGVRSLLMIPINIKGSPGYALSISSQSEERVWPENYMARLELLGEILVNALERKQAELSLRQKTEELDQFFNVSLDLLAIRNTDGYFLRLNPAWERTLGYTREELMAKRYLEFVHPDDLDRTREAISTLASQQKVFSFENRYRCKDGTYRWLEWSSVPAGKLIYAAARDITEHKRADEELAEAKQRLEAHMDNSPLAVVEFDSQFRVIRWSREAERLFGWTAPEVMGRAIAELHWVHEDDVESVRQVSADMLSGNRPCNLTVNRNYRKDGRVVQCEWYNSAIYDAQGRMTSILSRVLDITERKRTEQALRESEDRFRQVAENVGDFIWEVDAKGLYRYTSPSVERILGYTPDELIGKKHFYDLFAPEVREEIKEAVLRGFAAKESFRAFPNANLSKEGGVVYLETSGVPVLDAAGNLVGYRGADTDITQRKRSEEEVRKYQEHLEDLVKERTAELVMAMNRAEAANRAKSAFLANMSHELRAPLNSILGVAQLMERDREFPAKQRELLEILSRSGQQLFELIDDVLEMSRIEAGQTTIVSKTFDLHRFLDDLEEMMSPRAEKKGLRLIFERDSPLPKYIQTDGRKLRQILINLLGNAIKFTEKGGVTLRANFREGGDKAVRLEFEVKDTGIGLAQEDREKIFDPFVQLNPAQKASGGIGLGLAICHKFAALLGGEITVSSQVGRGATFKLDIGVQPAEGSDSPVPEARRQVMGLASGQANYRLLVVDDNLESRLLLRRLLEPVGFKVLEAASGPEAIDMYRKDQPQLIWMDIRMPGMDGYEAARRIREAERERRNEEGQKIHTPIIALTAGVMEDIGSPSLSGVFDDWVYKPFRETEVFDKIEKHLGIQFVSQPSVSSAVKAENSQDKAALTPADLSVLPADWLKEFFQTMEKGRSAQLLNLIDHIRPEHADLALALAEMVRIHQYEKLIPLTREALKEDANG